MGGNALLAGPETAQKVGLLLGSALDRVEILGPGHCHAQDDQQDFRQGKDDLPSVAWVLEGGKMVDKAGLGHRRPQRFEAHYE